MRIGQETNSRAWPSVRHEKYRDKCNANMVKERECDERGRVKYVYKSEELAI